MRQRWKALVAVGAVVILIGLYLCLAYFFDLPGHDLLADFSLVAQEVSDERAAPSIHPIGGFVGPILIVLGLTLVLAARFSTPRWD